MFSNLTISILMGVGAGAWIFSKVHNKTGKNTQSSLVVAGVAAIIIVLFLTIVLDMIFKK